MLVFLCCMKKYFSIRWRKIMPGHITTRVNISAHNCTSAYAVYKVSNQMINRVIPQLLSWNSKYRLYLKLLKLPQWPRYCGMPSAALIFPRFPLHCPIPHLRRNIFQAFNWAVIFLLCHQIIKFFIVIGVVVFYVANFLKPYRIAQCKARNCEPRGRIGEGGGGCST